MSNSKERLQAQLEGIHRLARASDAEHRAEIRKEIQELDNQRRILILRCLGGDLPETL